MPYVGLVGLLPLHPHMPHQFFHFSLFIVVHAEARRMRQQAKAKPFYFLGGEFGMMPAAGRTGNVVQNITPDKPKVRGVCVPVWV